jgi:hypothetical protein
MVLPEVHRGERQILPVAARLALIGGAVCFFTGCASQPVAQTDNPAVIACDPNQLWSLSQVELKNRGFSLDRVDRRSGLLETFPLTSAQWFEFWRDDVVGSEARAESSLQTIRRTVTLRMLSTRNNECHLLCAVTVERLSSPPTIVAGRMRARDLFGRSISGMPALNPDEPEKNTKVQWVFLGDDPDLESDILHKIAARVRKG